MTGKVYKSSQKCKQYKNMRDRNWVPVTAFVHVALSETAAGPLCKAAAVAAGAAGSCKQGQKQGIIYS